MPTDDWAPTVRDVGALLRSRTRDTNGNELGTFTRDTRPTDTQVVELIDMAAADLVDAVGTDDLPVRFRESASRVVTIGAALEVELTYFPEQVASERSPYDRLKALYDERLARLVTAVSVDIDVPGEDADEQGPSYAFPDRTYTPMVGWDSNW